MPDTIIDDLVECEQCGGRVTGTESIDGRDLCAVCSADYVACARCDRYTDDSSETVDGEVCPQCVRRYYRECERCEQLSEATFVAADGTVICDECVEDYWTCDGCCELIDSGNYCDSCQCDEDCSAGGLVNGYNYKPTPQFYGSGALYCGLELEVSAEQGQLCDNAETAIGHLGGVGYLKEDGSINGDTGYGFEIVTHPMSYDWAIEHFPWQMLTDLEQAGCTAAGNGLHVHVSRAGFETPSHVYRWMKFLYRNQRQVTILARRVSDHWAAFDEWDRRQVKNYAKGAKGARYRAINTQNTDTFELRVFASSLRPQQVKAALGLAAASVEYTRNLAVTDIVWSGGWEWSGFVTWLHRHALYAPLARELEELKCAS
jgi:hypothetical protein